MMGPEQVKERIRLVEDSLSTMTSYMGLQLIKCEWHGVMDAAADIRELQAELKAYRLVLSESCEVSDAQ